MLISKDTVTSTEERLQGFCWLSQSCNIIIVLFDEAIHIHDVCIAIAIFMVAWCGLYRQCKYTCNFFVSRVVHRKLVSTSCTGDKLFAISAAACMAAMHQM